MNVKKASTEVAQRKILNAIVAEALRQDESGFDHLASETRRLGSQIAKKWGWVDWPGLPGTFKQEA